MSLTVVTVTCPVCAFSWATETSGIPESVRHAAQVAVLDRDALTR